MLSFGFVAVAAGSADGEWQAEMPYKGGTVPSTSNFTVGKAGKLTGLMTVPVEKMAVENWKVEGDQISFKVVHEGLATAIFTGAVKADEIQFKQEVPGVGSVEYFVATRKR